MGHCFWSNLHAHVKTSMAVLFQSIGRSFLAHQKHISLELECNQLLSKFCHLWQTLQKMAMKKMSTQDLSNIKDGCMVCHLHLETLNSLEKSSAHHGRHGRSRSLKLHDFQSKKTVQGWCSNLPSRNSFVNSNLCCFALQTVGSLESTHDCSKNPAKKSLMFGKVPLYTQNHMKLTSLIFLSLSSQIMDPSGTRTAGSRLYNYGAKKP